MVVFFIRMKQSMDGWTYLDLTANNIGPEGAKAIAHSKSLKKLEVLKIGGNNIGDKGFTALSQSP